MDPYSFAGSSDLKLEVSVKISSLEGYQKPLPYSTLLAHPELRHRGSNTSNHSDLYVTARLWADSKPLALPTQTAYKAFKTSRTWNEWLSLPIRYCNVPLNTLLAITIWDLAPPSPSDDADGNELPHFASSFPSHALPFGGTTIPLFASDGTLIQGRQRCLVHRNKVADGTSDTQTPHTVGSKRRRSARENAGGDLAAEADEEDELRRLEELMKKHEMGEIPEVRWLDQLAFRRIEAMERAGLRNQFHSLKNRAILKGGNDSDTNTGKGNAENHDSLAEDAEAGLYHLYIELPRFDLPIVFTDAEYPAPPISTELRASSADVQLKPPPEVSFGPGINVNGEAYGDPTVGRLVRIYDPEVGIRDNPAENKHRRLMRSHRTGALDKEMKPNAKIRDELNTIMNYGPLHQLSDEEKDLIWKFRHHLARDKRALTKFIKSVSWNDPMEARQAVAMLPKWTEIDVDDALELLGPTFDNPAVRAYAVDRLRKSDDDELLLYLLQLVQALKFEAPPPAPPSEDSDAAAETNEEGGGAESGALHDASLARFLITRAADNFLLGNFFHWYLMVECDDRTEHADEATRRLFVRVEWDFMVELVRRPGGESVRKTLQRQGELITMLSKISRDVRKWKEDRKNKIERLKKFLADSSNELANFELLPLPLDPSVLVDGVIPNEADIFKSSLNPLSIPFRRVDGRTYRIIFKSGDDLRQDQLCIQIITLMDRLLRKENLDLKLSPYRILATAPFAGAVQYIPSKTLSYIMYNHRSILAYLRSHNPDPHAPLGVRREVMETYVRSCAGYCVITYLLGVGDRHLDNLLLAPSGHFFHADFGYMLGRDPKPFAPLMKLAREMVDGMGGAEHDYYAEFKEYCFTAYASLRKSANLILNLFALMSEANIPDIRIAGDQAVWKVQERFHLELNEEEAIRGFEGLIADSVNAVMPVVIDRLHGFVQHWRT